MIDFESLLAALSSERVEFIVIGGFAATIHGSAHVTVDLDIVYGRNGANIGRLVAALAPFAPYLRGAPAGLPFRFDVPTVEHGLNCRFVDLEALIFLKRAAGRPKDLERIAELELIAAELKSRPSG